jgi:hypothetical protein
LSKKEMARQIVLLEDSKTPRRAIRTLSEGENVWVALLGIITSSLILARVKGSEFNSGEGKTPFLLQ